MKTAKFTAIVSVLLCLTVLLAGCAGSGTDGSGFIKIEQCRARAFEVTGMPTVYDKFPIALLTQYDVYATKGVGGNAGAVVKSDGEGYGYFTRAALADGNIYVASAWESFAVPLIFTDNGDVVGYAVVTGKCDVVPMSRAEVTEKYPGAVFGDNESGSDRFVVYYDCRIAASKKYSSLNRPDMTQAIADTAAVVDKLGL